MFWTALRAWWDDDCTRLGASLAYYTLFAIAPILLVATAIAGMVFGAEAVRGRDRRPARSPRRPRRRARGARPSRRRQPRAAPASSPPSIGGITFLIASTGAFLELQVAFNTIWRVKPRPGAHLYAFVMDRVRSFGLVVAIGFLLLVSLAVTAALAALNAWLSSLSPTNPLLWSIVNTLVSIVVTTGAVRAAVSFPARRAPAVARRDDGRGSDGGAVHHWPAGDWLVSRPEQRRLELRRGRVDDDPAVVGVLLVPDPAVRRRVHARVRSAPGREGQSRSHTRRRNTRLRVCGQRPSSRWTAEDARIGGSGASRRGRQPGEAPMLRGAVRLAAHTGPRRARRGAGDGAEHHGPVIGRPRRACCRAQDPAGFDARVRTLIRLAPPHVTSGLQAYPDAWKASRRGPETTTATAPEWWRAPERNRPRATTRLEPDPWT